MFRGWLIFGEIVLRGEEVKVKIFMNDVEIVSQEEEKGGGRWEEWKVGRQGERECEEDRLGKINCVFRMIVGREVWKWGFLVLNVCLVFGWCFSVL